MTSERTQQLRDLAQRIADALPPEVEEVVLTGSVSRGMADEVSDIEMLIVTPEQLKLDECYGHARAAGLENIDSWGDQTSPTRRVSGMLEGVPIELIWWSRELAEASVDGFFELDVSSGADAIANGVALRTSGALARWQTRLADYPEELAKACDTVGDVADRNDSRLKERFGGNIQFEEPAVGEDEPIDV